MEAESADAGFHREQRQERQREAEEVARLGSFAKAKSASMWGRTVQRKAPSLAAHGPAYPAPAASLVPVAAPAQAAAPDPRHDIKGWRLWPRTTPLGPIAWKISPGLFRILLSARKNRRRALQSGAVEPTGV